MTALLLIIALIADTPNHPLNKNPELRSDVAGYFEHYGARHSIDPALLVYWAYRESSIRIDRTGLLGEKGICQAHGRHLRTCKRAGLDVGTWEGGIACMALLMDTDRTWCGSLEKGLRRYSTGSCERGEKFVRRRLKAWKRKVGR
jgi:hypothetical protein